MAHTIYENFVLANKVSDILSPQVDLNTYMTVDTDLTENAGMKKVINTYTATGNVQDLAMGEGNSADIEVSFTPTEYKVGTTQGRFKYYDEQEMTDPMVVDVGLEGIAKTMVNDFTTKAIAEYEKATLTLAGTGWTFDTVVDAIAKMNLEDETGLFLLISPADQANFRKALKDDLKDEVNASYLSDSLTRKAIASTLVFSNNNLYNTWLSEGTTGDTLMSTNRYKFSNPSELLSQQTGAAIQMSNGTGILVDSLAFKPWETYKPCLVTMRMGAYKNATEPKNITISTFNEGVGMLDIPGYPDNIHWSYDLNFQWIKAKMSSDETAFYNLSGDIMSSSYSIYCIMVPPCADADYSSYDPDAEMKQTLFNASLRYYNPSTKKMAEHYFHPTKPEGSSTGPKTTADKMDEWAFKNDITKVDAVYLGDFTFPVTYVGLSNCYPNLKIVAPKFDTANKNLYSRDLRIAGILLIPTEITKSNAE